MVENGACHHKHGRPVAGATVPGRHLPPLPVYYLPAGSLTKKAAVLAVDGAAWSAQRRDRCCFRTGATIPAPVGDPEAGSTGEACRPTWGTCAGRAAPGVGGNPESGMSGPARPGPTVSLSVTQDRHAPERYRQEPSLRMLTRPRS